MYGTALKHCCKRTLNFTHLVLIFTLNSNPQAHETQVIPMYIRRIDIDVCLFYKINYLLINLFIYLYPVALLCLVTFIFLFLRTKNLNKVYMLDTHLLGSICYNIT